MKSRDQCGKKVAEIRPTRKQNNPSKAREWPSKDSVVPNLSMSPARYRAAVNRGSGTAAVTPRMALLEQKRQQWARERDQMTDTWSPWGRPGGGAPSDRQIRPWHETNSRTNPSYQVVAPMAKQAPCPGILPPIPPSENGREEIRRRDSRDISTVEDVSPELDANFQQETSRTVSELRTFLRGANAPLDPHTKADLEKKRQRALEQQKAIQTQLEQRMRQKNEEKARRCFEERQEEERIEKERLRIEQQFLLEQQKQKMKEEAEAIKRIAVVEAIKTAQCTAPKVSKRPNRAQPEITPIHEEAASQPEQGLDSEVHEERHTVEKLTLGEDLFAPYTANRILTPTKYRNNHACVREFATQTDPTIPTEIPSKKPEVNRKSYERRQSSRRNRSKSSRKNTAKSSRQEAVQAGSPKPKRPFEAYAPSVKDKTVKPSRTCQESALRRTATTREPRSRDVKSRPAQQKERVIGHSEDLAAEPETSTDEVFEDPNHRPRRRQWDSPCRSEIPKFYTECPLLPDGRAVRRSRSNSVAHTTDRHRDGHARSSSPPVPAMRSKALQDDVTDSGRETMASTVQRTPGSPGLGAGPKAPHAAMLPWQLGALCQSRNLLQQLSIIRKVLPRF